MSDQQSLLLRKAMLQVLRYFYSKELEKTQVCEGGTRMWCEISCIFGPKR